MPRRLLHLSWTLLAATACESQAGRDQVGASALVGSSEIDTDPPVPTGVHPGATSAGVATDGRNFLVTWRDWRADPPERIYATRVSGAGRLLDPIGLVIATGGASFIYEDPTHAAFDGTNYLVVWADVEHLTAGGVSSAIFGARVSPRGSLVDAAPIVVHREPQFYSARWADVACGTQECLVVWDDGQWSLAGMRLDHNGAPLDTALIRIGDSSSQPSAVAFDGVNYQAVWEDWTNGIVIRGARIRPSDGAVLESVPPVLSPTVGASRHGVRIACEGGEACLVSWRGTDPGVARIEHGVAVSIRSGDTAGPLAYDGVSYHTARTVSLQSGAPSLQSNSLDSMGAPTGPTAELTTQQVWVPGPALAATSTRVLVAWTGEPVPGRFSDIFGVRTGTGSEVLDPLPIPLTSRANTEKNPALAFDGTQYLAIWLDDRSTLSAPYSGGIFATRISTAGVGLDPVAFRVAPFGLDPQVGFDGTDFVVVWAGDCGFGCAVLDSARVSTAGVLLDAVPRRLYVKHGSCGNPYVSTFGVGIACGSGTCLAAIGVLCESFSPGTIGGQLDAVLLDRRSGSVRTASIALFDQPATDVTVGFDGSQYLAVWSAGDLYGARVDPNGDVLDPNGVAIVSSTVAAASHPRLIHDGQRWTMVFERDGRVWRTRVSSAAVSLDQNGLAMTSSSAQQRAPCIANDGTSSLVVWNDASGSALEGAWIDALGTVRTSSGVRLAAGSSPSLIGSSGQLLLAYQRFEAASPFDAMRVHARIVTSECDYGTAPDGTACPGGSCSGGFCQAPPDAGQDAGPIADAASDAGGASDAGIEADATPDAGPEDGGGALDAELEPDAGIAFPDAALAEDARPQPVDGSAAHAPDTGGGATEPPSAGCSCRAAGAGEAQTLPSMILLVLMVRLRRRR